MLLDSEWRDRLNTWVEELKRHFYLELGSVGLAGFATREQLSPEEAANGDFQPMPPGTKWGGKWEYGWFRGTAELPDEANGKRVVLRVNPGGNALVFVNGRAVGARDGQHTEITLTRAASPGDRYEILIESYAGHGPFVRRPGPVPPGRQSVPEPPATQLEIGESSFGIWREEAYQLWLDVETLIQLRDNIDDASLRVAEIDAGLNDFTLIVDFELPVEEMLETFAAARRRLRPLLECVNGSTVPEMFAFGHAHLDVAWLWPLAETERKSARTFANQLALIDEYPEYMFQQSQPHLYRMVKRRYPQLYGRVIEAVEGGGIRPDGAMWIEADTNISGGEALIRQFLHGLRYFRDELGVECKVLWLPDVFGYSGAMPQIMRGCGIKYFSTMKILWIYHGGDLFPYNTFTWEGIDGSEVITHLHWDYSSVMTPAAVIKRWNERLQKDGISTRLFPFGFGDGGGGATRNHLEFARRMKNLEGVPKVRHATPAEFFEDLEARGMPDARYVGELYFQAHRGTYTSQAKTKKGNRMSEFALREAEMWCVASRAMKGLGIDADRLDGLWKMVLLNQFHDVLPGTSIARVYEQTEANYAEVIAAAGEIAATAASSLTDDSPAITVFNSLNQPRKALVELPRDFNGGATDADGDPLCVQHIDEAAYVEATVPSCGWTTILSADPAPDDNPAGGVRATETSLENELIRVEFDGCGRIAAIFDKEAGCELSAGLCNEMKMYKDVPSNWDAWDIDSMYRLTPVDLPEPAEVEVVASGALLGAIRVRRRLNGSDMTQTIRLRRASRRVDFETAIDWREDHKMLKVAFAVGYHASEAVHEIQFGHIRRPTHESRPFDRDRFEVCNNKWSALVEEGRGFAVLNDCKYGLDVRGNCINLTLLRSPKGPDMDADKGIQKFTYSFYAWNGSLADSGVVNEAYDLNCPVTITAGAAGVESMLATDAPNIVIEAVKPAEDGSDDVIVRLYEAMRTATRCMLATTLPVASAEQTNMLEEHERELTFRDGKIELEFRPFEIKTLRLRG